MKVLKQLCKDNITIKQTCVSFQTARNGKKTEISRSKKYTFLLYAKSGLLFYWTKIILHLKGQSLIFTGLHHKMIIIAVSAGACYKL